MDELKQSNTTKENKINDPLKSIHAKGERNEQLEHRMNDLEQHSRKRNVIVSGLNMHSYSDTARTSVYDGDGISESSAMRKNFVKFAQENMPLAEIEITAIHDLPKGRDGTMPQIVQFFCIGTLPKDLVLCCIDNDAMKWIVH